MTTISAKIIKDSVGPNGKRITTMQLRYPRWIHAEGRTHRMLAIGEEEEVRTPSVMEAPELSRNASSSRAIPVARMIQDVLDDPAVPLFWGANQKGMQAGEECDTRVDIRDALGLPHAFGRTREEAWLFAMNQAISIARAFDEAGYHKQIVNRLLEPFSHINVLVTATEWDNFYALRRHKDAEPHIHLLADRMWEAKEASTPRQLQVGEWHLPYVEDEDWEILNLGLPRHRKNVQSAIKISVARSASLSYMTVDGKPMTVKRATDLYDKLVGAHPLHASPAEHQAQATDNRELSSGNFKGWLQYRQTLVGQNVEHYIPS